jgi:hypothetical protein
MGAFSQSSKHERITMVKARTMPVRGKPHVALMVAGFAGIFTNSGKLPAMKI